MTDEKRHLPKLSETELNNLATLHYQKQHRMMLDQLELMALPHAPENFDRSKLSLLADALLSEQLMLAQTIMPDMIHNRESPDLGLQVWKAVRVVSADGETDIADFVAPKRLDGIKDPEEALAVSLAFAFVHTPVARAILRMHGWTYRFIAKPEELQTGDGEADGDEDEGEEGEAEHE
jgi:hypothetical protein